ncbi:MAG: helix-turn-helix transcriptional regulator [Hyphomicrobiales bacterium]|jgi:transcriptional regulator with XRE-family HTH domain|nr:helix-turn-helix transcriptional regulator [Hyphomicrobiales bacterium]
MSYVGEEVINLLQEARSSAGLSQRALSEKAGISQSHISQIESGTLEPGLSKLIQIARALDLELVLVPRKMIPAIKNLTAVSRPERESPTFALKELNRAARIIKKKQVEFGDSAFLDRMQSDLQSFRHVRLSPADLNMIRRDADRLKSLVADEASSSRLRNIAREWTLRRNTLVHGPSDGPRPAYAIDEDDDA